MLTTRLRHATVFAVLFVTGACGLIYEVVWQRYLANFLGSEAKASALILAVFLGGLAIGYLLFGRLSRERASGRLICLTGLLELGIGVWAVFFPQLYGFFFRLPWQSTRLEFPIVMALVLVPTCLMGGTLPLLTQALTFDLSHAGRMHSRVYFYNTLGAFFGCLLAGFVLLPSMSLSQTTLLTAGVNWLAGAALLAIGLTTKSQLSGKTADAHLAFSVRYWRHYTVALISGFTAITLQTALIRSVGLAVGASEYAFALVVALFVALLALGARSVAKGATDSSETLWRNQLMAAGGLVLAYLSIPYWPYGAHVIRALLTSVGPNFYIYHAVLFTALALITGLCVRAQGRTMPLLFGALAERLEDLGATVGSLYFLNTVGCVLGGLVGGFLLYYVLDLDQVFKLCAALLLLSAAVLALNLKKWFAPLALAAAVFLLPGWNGGLEYGTFRLREATENTFKGARLFYQAQTGHLTRLYHRDGPTATMSVVEFPDGSGKKYPSILINGKSDGSTLADMPTMRLMAHIPALFSTGDLSQVAVIGFGTGVTVGSLGLYPDVHEVHVFELSSMVQEYAPLFDFFNHVASKSDKVRWRIGDAYREFLTDPTQYGLIASEPSNPWMTGVERLYSREFLTMAAKHLKSGGVYAQWFHEYDMSLPVLGMVFNTFAQVFPELRLFRTTQGDLLILGANDNRWPERFSEFARKSALPEVQNELNDMNIHGIEDLLAREIHLPKQYFADNGEQTLDFPTLSYRAGYDFFLGSVIDLQTLSESPRLATWERRFSNPRLSELWLNLHPEMADHMFAAACNDFAANRFEQMPRYCQQLMIQLSGLENEKKLDSPQARVLALVLDRDSAKNKRTAPEAERDLKFLGALDSQRFKVSKHHILDLAEPCFAGSRPFEVRCRIQAVKNLAAIGEVQAAYDLYFSLKPWLSRLPGETRHELVDLILDASRANAFKTQ